MKINRREFLKAGSAASIAAHPLVMSLAGLNTAAALAALNVTDYKAVVCIFLNGGNDYANTVVPYDTDSYQRYFTQRPNFGYDDNTSGTPTIGGKTIYESDGKTAMADLNRLNQLALPVIPVLEGGVPVNRQFALAPPLTRLYEKFTGTTAKAFEDKRMAVLLNVGTLTEPIPTRDDYKDENIPPRLFSHNDQTAYWQSFGLEGERPGWGGLIADQLMYANSNAPLSCINVGGSTVFLTGTNAVQYKLKTSGALELEDQTKSMFGSSTCATALTQIISGSGSISLPHMFEREYVRMFNRADETASAIESGLGSIPDILADNKYSLLRPDSANTLGAQLGMVAKLIAARGSLLNNKGRQVFYVSLGGFDTHANLAADHPGLTKKVAEAMAVFDDLLNDSALYEGSVPLSNKVTTFTASEFGRTLTANDTGSDHGWGSMHFVLGGAVKGGKCYGVPPKIGAGVGSDVNAGRLIPTMAVDQVCAKLAMWMGVDPAQLTTLFPHLGNGFGAPETWNLDFIELQA